jgi:hypothetical protein
MKTVIDISAELIPGTWFLVPVGSASAVGIVCASRGDGILAGFFWGPLVIGDPSIRSLDKLRPDDAVYAGRFGDTELVNRRWRILGRSEIAQWPVPQSKWHDPVSGEWHCYTFDANLNIVDDRVVEERMLDRVFSDGSSDGGFVEQRLKRLLSSESTLTIGDDGTMSGLQLPVHYVYTTHRELAIGFADHAMRIGYAATITESADKQSGWLILVRQNNHGNVEVVADSLSAVAAEWGVEYDGWEK